MHPPRAMGRRIAVLAIALGLVGALAQRTVPAATAVGSGDVTPPAMVYSVEVTGPNTPLNDVVLYWNDLLDQTRPLVLADFDVKLNGVSLGLSGVEFSHAGYYTPDIAISVMTVFLSAPVAGPYGLTVSYTPGMSPIRDLAGNDAEPAINVPVDVTADPAFDVVFALVDGAYAPDHLGLMFSDAVDPASLPPPTAFEVTRNGTLIGPPTSVTIFPTFSGRILDLGLPEGFRSGDSASIAYTAPLGGGIKNLAGTLAPDFQYTGVPLLLVAQDSTQGTISAGGGTVSTDAGDPGTTAQDPVATTVSVPGDATVAINEGAVALPPSTAEYTFIGETVQIEVTAATTATNPIVIDFSIDKSILAAAGATEATVQLLRNGVLVPACTGASGTASPDPCIAARTAVPAAPDPLEYAVLRVNTSHASEWTFAVRRPFLWAGFSQPVDNPPTINVVKAGQAIPVRFTLGGDRGLAIFASDYPLSERVDCSSGVTMDPIEEAATAGSSSLNYDPATGFYTYVWKTNGAWSSSPGGPCRRLTIGFVDGSSHSAVFKFK